MRCYCMWIRNYVMFVSMYTFFFLKKYLSRRTFNLFYFFKTPHESIIIIITASNSLVPVVVVYVYVPFLHTRGGHIYATAHT